MDTSLNYGVISGLINEFGKLASSYNGLEQKIEMMIYNMASKPSKIYMNNREVMDACGISLNTLKEWRATGILKGKKIGGIWLHKTEDVQSLIN